ncbi:ATP-binding protein [Parachlamydia sp. AcF125]|uniref:ATP-dependent nuclease n=1 Tax=Parachlamydia sp. AcF125 TaxID=2795736 RepID=UPI001BC9C943|nr:ATP-binding protein [Parachlamydia sp. AcF125]MBS4169273.1 hypothetical protein [Parachlamydia sp. AcF125]
MIVTPPSSPTMPVRSLTQEREEDEFSKPGYLKKLEVRGPYQNFPSGFTWEAIPMFSVVAGKNGAGKTNLLQAILFGCLANSNQRVKVLGEHRFQICSLQNTDRLTSLRDDLDTQSKEAFDREMEESCKRLNKYALHKLLQKGVDASDGQPLFDEVIESTLQEMNKKDGGYSFPDFERELVNQYKKTVAPHLMEYNSIEQVAKFTFNKLLDKNLRERGEKREAVKKTFEEINQYLIKCKFKYILSEESFAWNANNGELGSICLTFACHSSWMKDSFTPIRLTSLSSGERIILLVLLWRFDQRHMQEKGVILLDEPDAHLNPSAVKEVIDIIKTKLVAELGIQVIMTSHHPTTVSFVPKKCLFILENEAPGFEPSIKPVANKKQAMNILSGNLVYVNEPFAVVFVEGEKDKQFYSMLAKRLNDSRLIESQLIFKVHGAGNNDELSSCSAIRSLIEKIAGQTTEPLSQFVFGLIDGDNFNHEGGSRNLKALKRYSLENYMLDPIHLFLCLDYIRQEVSADPNLQPHLSECIKIFTSLVSSLSKADQPIEQLLSDRHFCQQLVDVFYARVRQAWESAFQHREQNLSILNKILQQQIEACEAIIKGTSPIVELMNVVGKISQQPIRAAEFLKELLTKLGKEFEQVAEQVNPAISNFLASLTINKNSEINKGLSEKKAEQKRIFETLKVFFENLKKDLMQKYSQGENLGGLTQLLQQQIEACEVILKGDSPIVKLMDAVVDISQKPSKATHFLKEYLSGLKGEFEQIIEPTNYGVFNLSACLIFDDNNKKNKDLLGKNSDQTRIAEKLKGFFEKRAKNPTKQSEKEWNKLVRCLNAREIKIMDQSSNVDWESKESEKVYLVLNNRLHAVHRLQYPRFLLYLRGHNLQTIYEKILKIPHELLNDFAFILDQMQSVSIPSDLLEIYSSMKDIIEENEVQAPQEENSGVIPYFHNLKTRIAKEEQRAEEEQRHAEIRQAMDQKGIEEENLEFNLGWGEEEEPET